MASDVRRYRVTALTPVHIGTGEELHAGLDFYIAPANQINMLDFDRMLALCAASGIDPMPYVERGSFGELFAPSRTPSQGPSEIDPRLAPLLKLRGSHVPEEKPGPKPFDPSEALAYRTHLRAVNPPETVLEQIKTVSSLGYVPGSSIKGAIRTALWSRMLHDEASRMQVEKELRQQGERGRPERAAQGAENALFGQDPNHDLLRTLQISDAYPGSRVSVAEVVIADLNRSGKLQWKNLSTRRIESDPKKATSIYCECLPPGAELTVDIRVDSWLFDQKKLQFDRHRGLVAGFEEACTAWAAELVGREVLFYRHGGLQALAAFYENRIQKELTGEGGFLIQVGWGTGWTEKTAGHLLDGALQEDLRRWFDLGKLLHSGCGGEVRRSGRSYSCYKCRNRSITGQDLELVDPFPKTRKVVFENGAPSYPMGWLKFSRM